MDFTQEQLDNLIQEVRQELNLLTKSDSVEAQKLQKDETKDSPAEESTGDEGPSEPEGSQAADREAKAQPGEPSAPDSGVAPPDASASPDQSAAPAHAEGTEGGEIEPAPTVEGLKAEYCQLDPEALKMHFLAAKEALIQSMGAAGQQEAATPVAPPAPAASPSAAPMMMSEKESFLLESLAKAEARLKELDASLTKKSDELAKQEEALTKLTTTMANAIEKNPVPTLRKSVRGLSDLQYLNKSGSEEPKTLSKAEVDNKLMALAREGKLSKNDRAAVTDFFVNPKDGLSKVAHLLK